MDMAFFFRGNDTSMDLSTFYGLYKADGTPKKSALAFSMFHDMSQFPHRRAIHMRGMEGSLYAIAGEGEEGKVALLVSNISGAAIDYRVESPLEILSIKEVSDQFDAIQEIAPIDGLIPMPGYGVHLIEFE